MAIAAWVPSIDLERILLAEINSMLTKPYSLNGLRDELAAIQSQIKPAVAN